MHEILIRHFAEKQMDKLPVSARIKILDKLEDLRREPRPAGAVTLNDENVWRIRVGYYRVVYEIEGDRLIVLILRVAHRKDVYRGL